MLLLYYVECRVRVKTRRNPDKRLNRNKHIQTYTRIDTVLKVQTLDEETRVKSQFYATIISTGDGEM